MRRVRRTRASAGRAGSPTDAARLRIGPVRSLLCAAVGLLLAACGSGGDGGSIADAPLLHRQWAVPAHPGDYDGVLAVWVIGDRVVRVANDSIAGYSLADGHQLYFTQITDWPVAASPGVDADGRGVVHWAGGPKPQVYDSATGKPVTGRSAGGEKGLTKRKLTPFTRHGHRYAAVRVQDADTYRDLGLYAAPDLSLKAYHAAWAVRLHDGRILIVPDQDTGDHVVILYRADRAAPPAPGPWRQTSGAPLPGVLRLPRLPA
jgi:hypothetical protein